MKEAITLFIDFDSTFTKVEALDVLTEIIYKNNLEKDDILNQIANITNLAMNGELSFDIALKQRIELLNPTKIQIDELIVMLKTLVSDSFKKHQSFIRNHASSIYIISGGFKDFILPVVEEFGIASDHVFANEFLFDEDGNGIGFNESNPMAKAKGKVEVTKALNIKGHTIIIGDGFTDYEIKEAGYASAFYLYTENITRTHLIEKSDKVISNLDELIELHYA